MRRFHTELPTPLPGIIRLEGSEARHIKTVLRMQAGDAVVLFDGSGREADATIHAMDDLGVDLAVSGERTVTTESPLTLTIGISILKEKKIDDLLPGLVELGVDRIVVFQSARSIPDPDAKRMKKRLARWEKIATEALKQCRRSRVPEILWDPKADILLGEKEDAETRILFWEEATTALSPKEPGFASALTLVFGPEGGFTEKEAGTFREADYKTVSLGPRILRAQTAILAGATLGQYLLGDLRVPPKG